MNSTMNAVLSWILPAAGSPAQKRALTVIQAPVENHQEEFVFGPERSTGKLYLGTDYKGNPVLENIAAHVGVLGAPKGVRDLMCSMVSQFDAVSDKTTTMEIKLAMSPGQDNAWTPQAFDRFVQSRLDQVAETLTPILLAILDVSSVLEEDEGMAWFTDFLRNARMANIRVVYGCPLTAVVKHTGDIRRKMLENTLLDMTGLFCIFSATGNSPALAKFVDEFSQEFPDLGTSLEKLAPNQFYVLESDPVA